MTVDDVTIRTDLRPGDLGRLIWLHGASYDEGDGHFGLAFEAYVARTIADFILDNDAKGRIWLAERGDDLIGCAAMVDRGDRGQLRWVLLAPSARGCGLGQRLVGAAIDYAAQQNWREVFLETTRGLDASMAIYRKLGFEIISETPEELWSGNQNLITMVKEMDR